MTPKFGWWNVVDGAVLQSYSDNQHHNVAQRWLRLEKKAAKVGKGLFKNGKARKLVSQHWLEAVDPLHRYGHNLRFYFEEWCKAGTKEPFFYWLDSGEGKDLNLDQCDKTTLQNERIRYLGPKERERYEVAFEDGKLLYNLTRDPVNTTKGEKWIFVMSTSGQLYIGKKERGNLQHSSFLAGGAATSAGRLRVDDGTIKQIEAHSGHYRPTLENFKQFINILTSNGADLSNAKIQYSSEEMLKPSDSSKAREVKREDNEPRVEKDNIPKSTSHNSERCTDGDDHHDKFSPRQDSFTDEDFRAKFRDLTVDGKHDIHKHDPCINETDLAHKSQTSGQNLSLLVTANGLEKVKGPFSAGEENGSKKARPTDSAVQNENQHDIEKFPLVRSDCGCEANGSDQLEGLRVKVAEPSEKSPWIEDEKKTEEVIEETNKDSKFEALSISF